MRRLFIQLLFCAAFFLWSQNAVAKRGSSAFSSEINELDNLSAVAEDSVLDTPNAKENADLSLFNDLGEEEFPENAIIFDEDGDVALQPTTLYYNDCPLSITAAREFVMTNNMNKPLTVFTVRSNNRQFHSTLTKNQEIAGGGQLKVHILYLPQQVEYLTADLTIVTSRGEYSMPIKANSVENPYRVNPQLGVRFPAGHSVLETPIVVYNPHKETLQITEVFTTETYLSLKGAAFQGVGSDPDALPSVQRKASQKDLLSDPATTDSSEKHILWSIPPGTSKEIITLSIDTDLIPGFHNGFLHIKTDHANLVMPVELQVLNTLVYAQHEEIKFGVFTSPQTRITQDLWLNNNGREAVQVLEIIAVDVDPNLEIELVQPSVIYPGEKISSRVAKLHYTGKHEGKYRNKLLVMTNNSNAASAVVEVIYSAFILHGGIQYERALTLMSVEVYNQTYPFECSQCDSHGARLGYNDDLYAALLDEYYLKQNQPSDYNNPPTTTTTTTNGHITNPTANTHTNTIELSIADRPEHLLTHTVRIGNFFDAPLALLSVTFNSCEEFISTDFRAPNSTDILHSTPADKIVVNKLESWQPIKITLKAALVYALYRENHDFLPKVCFMDLKTNISTHRVPIHVVSGALSIEYMDMPMIEDFGSLNVTAALRSATTSEESHGNSDNSDNSGNSGNKGSGGQDATKVLNKGTRSDSDLEIQFTENDSHNWQCDSPLCQSVNSDIFHIDMGNQSIHEPRLLRIVLVNNNPIQLPISLDYASHDACMCYETHWPLSNNTVEFVEPILTRAHPRNWADSARNKDFCMCLEPSNEGDDANAIMLLKQQHYDPDPYSHAVKSNKNANSKILPYGVETLESTVFTISLRDLKNCRVYPTMLKGFSNVAMSECRSGAAATPLVPETAKMPTYLRNGERSSIRVDLHSQYQRLQLHLHFTARFARFRTTVASSALDLSQGGVFVLGQATPLVVRTRSSFTETIKDFHYFVEPNMIFRTEHEVSLAENAVLKTWHTGVYATNMCSTRSDKPLHDVNQVPLTTPPTEDESLRGTNLYRCQHNILTEMNFSDENNAVSVMTLLQKQDKYMSKVNLIAPKIAHENAVKLKQAWAGTFSKGIRMPPLGLHMLSPHTTHTYRMENLTLQSPQAFAPHSYRVKMPTIRVGQVQWVYLTVHNPFDTTLSYALLEDANDDVTKRMKSLGGLYFLPQALEEQQKWKPLRVSSRYQCPTLNLLQMMFTPCECIYQRNSEGFYMDNDLYCDTDYSLPPGIQTHPLSFDNGAGVNVAAVLRAKGLSMIQQATQFRAPAAVLTGLDKIFPSESRTATKNKDQNTESKPHASEYAFLPQSTTENLWVVPPRTSVQIGPILYGPQVQKHGFLPTTDTLTSFYLFNNFTGYDRIDVLTSSGNAYLELYAVSSCVPNRANETQELHHKTPNNAPVCMDNTVERFDVVPATAPEVVATHTVVVESLRQLFHLYVRNSGEVGASVEDIILDGISCLNPPSAPSSLFGWAKVLLFGPEYSYYQQLELHNICTTYPQSFPGNATMVMYLIGPETCANAVTRRVISINMEKNPPGEVLTMHNDPSKRVSFEITLQFTPELIEQCMHESQSTLGYKAMRGVCLLALLGVLAQLWSVGVLTSFQRKKYTHAKQVKARRVRSPTNKRSSNSVAGSPTAIAATTSNDTAASIANAPCLIPGELPAKAQEPRGIIPAKRNLGIDLSDVLMEEGHADNGSNNTNGFGGYKAERRERESLGSEPSVVEWSVHSRFRAVEALRQSRAAAAAASASASAASTDAGGTMTPVQLQSVSAAASPAASPVRLSSTPLLSTVSPTSPEKPNATPQKGPLQVSPAKPASTEPARPAATATIAAATVAIATVSVMESAKAKPSAPPGLKAIPVVAPTAVSSVASLTVEKSVELPVDEVSSVETDVPVLSTSTSTSSSGVFESPPGDKETATEAAVVTCHDALSNSSSTDDASATPGPPVSGVELSTSASSKEMNDAGSKKAAAKDAITPHTPVTPTLPVDLAIPTDSATVSAVAETKEKKSRRDRIKAKEAKARAVAALETIVSLESTPSPANSAPTSARLSNSSSENSDVSGALSSASPVVAVAVVSEATTEAAGKQLKVKNEKGEKVDKTEKATSKKATKVTPGATPAVPAAIVPAPVTNTPAVAPAVPPALATVPAAKGKVKPPTKTAISSTAAATPVAPEAGHSPLKIETTSDPKPATASNTASTITWERASKPPLATRGKLSPLRLPQQPHSSSSSESRTTEDSPLFRYSGQLLDPSRGDSTAELNALPDYPTPMMPSLGPFPSLDDTERLSLGDNQSSLLDPLSQVLWPGKDDVTGHLGLDLDLELDLTHLDLKYNNPKQASLPLASPDNILRTGIESELRVTADPFFSRKYDNPPAAKPNKGTVAASSLRDRTTSASNYLNDLLSSAGGPFDDLDDFSLGGHPSHTNTTNTTARGGKGSAREWWPSGAMPSESLTNRASLHDPYFDLGHANSGGRFPGGSPQSHWGSPELHANEARRGPGYSPQFPEPDLYGNHANAGQRFPPVHQSSQDDVYQRGLSVPPPLAYNAALQRDSFYNRSPQAAGIYNEPQELSRPVFDRTDRGGRESEHTRYHGVPQGGYAQPSHQLLHQQLPPAQRHMQHQPPQGHLHQGYNDPHEAMSSHSYDFLGLDRVLDDDDGGGNWVRELSHSNDEHAPGRDRRLSGAGHNAPYGYAPEPAFGGYRENIPDPRAAAMHVGSPPSGPQYMQNANVGAHGQQQQLRRLEQLRNTRQNPGTPPGGLAPQHHQQTGYGTPSSQHFDMHSASGFPDPFSRPEPVYAAPSVDPEAARWQALNNTDTRQGHDIRARTTGTHAPPASALRGPPPGMQQLARPSNAAPLAGYSMSQLSHSHGYNAQLHTHNTREQVFQPFGQELNPDVAPDRNFFHPQSFFGDAAGSLVSNVALEALEGEE